MSRGSTPRNAQTATDFAGFAVQFNAVAFRAAPLSQGWIVTIGRVTPFIPMRDIMPTHAIAGHLRLPQPTPVHALMPVLHWLRC